MSLPIVRMWVSALGCTASGHQLSYATFLWHRQHRRWCRIDSVESAPEGLSRDRYPAEYVADWPIY